MNGGNEKDYFVNNMGQLDFTETKENYKSLNMTMPSENNRNVEMLMKMQLSEQRKTNEKLDQNTLVSIYKNYSFKQD